MRIAFTTLGCKINQYETDLMRQDALAVGNAIVPFDSEADIYVINTCSVTSRSDYQCRQEIRSAIKRGPLAKVIVTGCYAETRPDEIKKIPGVSLVLGNQEKNRITQYITTVSSSQSTIQSTSPVRVKAVRGERTRGFLKIQDGCNKRCSYCIVPLARGNSQSADPKEVLQEFEQLIQSGCPEIVLTGIHIGTYGADLPVKTSLTQLIHALMDKRGQVRVRLSSIEPREITPELIELLGKGMCRHLHIPLQSGDDSLLTAMRRDYTSDFYHKLLNDITGSVPGIALGTDVMVGFPGEGDAEFENTYRLVENSPLTHLHVFSYSPRPGTPASTMKGQVPQQVKKERGEALRSLGSKKNLSFRTTFSGSELNVVVERKTDASSQFFTGLTDNYIRVSIKGAFDSSIANEIRVKIVEVSENATIGNVIA